MALLLAFDTAGERVAVALARDGLLLAEAVESGGSRASATLLPAVRRVLAAGGATLAALDAIAFGRGPGAFTGIRTACSVAQGLAWGADRPVLPLDDLRLVAEAGLDEWAPSIPETAWAVVDARMDEVYAASYRRVDGDWSAEAEPFVGPLDALHARWRCSPPAFVAGDALVAYAGRIELGTAARLAPSAWPKPRALAAVAEAAWRAGAAVDASLALPVYLRDKVALTTVEREAARAARAAVPSP